jgi:hypothetical protein
VPGYLRDVPNGTTFLKPAEKGALEKGTGIFSVCRHPEWRRGQEKGTDRREKGTGIFSVCRHPEWRRALRVVLSWRLVEPESKDLRYFSCDVGSAGNFTPCGVEKGTVEKGVEKGTGIFSVCRHPERKRALRVVLSRRLVEPESKDLRYFSCDVGSAGNFTLGEAGLRGFAWRRFFPAAVASRVDG